MKLQKHKPKPKKSVRLSIDEDTHQVLIVALGFNWRGIQSSDFREITTAKLLFQAYRKTAKMLIARSYEFPYTVSIDAFHASVLIHSLTNNVYSDVWTQSTANWIIEKVRTIN